MSLTQHQILEIGRTIEGVVLQEEQVLQSMGMNIAFNLPELAFCHSLGRAFHQRAPEIFDGPLKRWANEEKRRDLTVYPPDNIMPVWLEAKMFLARHSQRLDDLRKLTSAGNDAFARFFVTIFVPYTYETDDEAAVPKVVEGRHPEFPRVADVERVLIRRFASNFPQSNWIGAVGVWRIRGPASQDERAREIVAAETAL